MYGLKNVRNRRSDSLSRVGWDQLESLLAIYYRGQGYHVDHVGTGAANARFDGGIDLKLHRDDEYIVVQCKHWNAKQVPHNEVHQLIGIMVTEGATGAILVTSGEFSAYARESAAKHGKVSLIDGDGLRRMIDPLPGLVAADDKDARWRPGYAGAGEAPGTSQPSAVGPEALVFRSPRAAMHRPVVESLPSLNWILWTMTLLGAIGFVLVIRALLDRTASSAGTRAPVVQIAEPRPLPSPSGVAPGLMYRPSTGELNQRDSVGAVHPVRPRPQTAAEIRESQRKADAAMKILEATTPEM